MSATPAKKGIKLFGKWVRTPAPKPRKITPLRLFGKTVREAPRKGENSILNPATGRWVSTRGKMGKLLLLLGNTNKDFRITHKDCLELYDPVSKECVSEASPYGGQLASLYKHKKGQRYILQKERGTIKRYGFRPNVASVFFDYMLEKWSNHVCVLSRALRATLSLPSPPHVAFQVSNSMDRSVLWLQPSRKESQEYTMTWRVQWKGSFDAKRVKTRLTYPSDLQRMVDACATSKKRFFGIILNVSATDIPSKDSPALRAAAHLNCLILDFQMGTMERFEPHGLQTSPEFLPSRLDHALEATMSQLFAPHIQRYLPPSIVCPTKGFQWIEMDQLRAFMNLPKNEKGMPHIHGMCAMWSLWYMELRFKYPDVSRDDLIYEAMSALASDYSSSAKKTIRHFIEGYANYFTQVALQRKSIRPTLPLAPVSEYKAKVSKAERRADLLSMYPENLEVVLPELEERRLMMEEERRSRHAARKLMAQKKMKEVSQP